MRPDEDRNEPEGDDATDLTAPDDRQGFESHHDLGVRPETTPADRTHRSLEILAADDLDNADDELDRVYEDDEEEAVRTVLITGASGNLGRKLRAAWEDAYDLVLIDRVSDADDAEIVRADLSELDESWLRHFHGVDTVVHLAADPNEFATWEELVRPNLDILANVFHACALAGVDRLIFASSNHVMGGYRELGDMPITVDLPPKPDGPYGATKLMGERIGRSLGRAFDITFVALRLGWIQPGANRPDTLPDDWSRSMWLSNNDLIRLLDCAVEAELGDCLFVVVNGMSNNRGMRWDLSPAAELLGYSPEDDAYAEEL
jgi:NAD(P)-dependent dehydrogenase (short-subunit alcohol dehydrogenase family)